MGSKRPPEPPKPPQIERRIAFYPLQAIGVPLLALLPILASFGVFDTRIASVVAEENSLRLTVEYPQRLRHRTFEPLVVTVRNDSGRELTELELKLKRSYFEQFQDIKFEPEPQEIDEENLVFKMNNVGAGESRRILGHYEADEIGSHEATVETATELGEGPKAAFSTFVMP